MRCAVVPLVRARHAFVRELVLDRRPALAAVVGTLNELAEPAAALRCKKPVRLRWRSFDVVDLPAGEERPAHIPLLSLAVGRENERTLPCPDEHSDSTHLLDPLIRRVWSPGMLSWA